MVSISMKEKSFPAHINNGKEQTCMDHCRNVAYYAQDDLNSVGLGSSAYLAGILHDCGKFTEEFRNYITSASSGKDVRKGSVIHSFAGVYLILERYHSNISEPYNLITSELIAYAIGAHHGLFDCVDEEHVSRFEYRLLKQPEYEKKAIDSFLKNCCDDDEIDSLFQNSLIEIESCISSMAAISNSNDELDFYIGLLARLLCAAVMDGDKRDTKKFMNDEDFSSVVHATPSLWNELKQNLEDTIINYPSESKIKVARKEISDICFHSSEEKPGIYRLNVPTGGGKTLSSMRFALSHAEKYGKKRIIYAAPFISIIDQNASVIKKAIGREDIVLEHHSNIIRDECDTGTDQQQSYELLTETWDSPIIITTLVQLLNTFLSGRSSCVRRFQSLCDSVIIIDEVQSVPEKVLSLFNLTLNFLSSVCGATIILCSATQPCLEETPHKANISPHNIISENKYNEYYRIFKRTEIINEGNYRLEDIPTFVREVFERTNSLLVICNTKAEAAEIYNIISDGHNNCYHLSASMCMAHRKEILRQLFYSLENGEKTICISTQVIEAGVDISFDTVIRLTSGIDSIVQAAGRCNRNGEKGDNSKVYIIRCVDEKLGNLSEIISAQNATNNLLACYERTPELFDNDIASDKSVSFYYRSLYKSFPKDYHDFTLKGYPSIYNLLSDNRRYVHGNEEAEKYILRQAFKKAGDLFGLFDRDGATVVVPYGRGKELISELCTTRAQNDMDYLRGVLQKAKDYSVSVSNSQLMKLQQSGAILSVCSGEVLVLHNGWYNKSVGLQSKYVGEEDNEWNIQIL